MKRNIDVRLFWILPLIILAGCGSVALPLEAEQALYQHVIYNPESGTGCTLPGDGCTDIRIYDAYTLSLEPDMQATGILMAWCIHWGGLERNPITGDDVRFDYHTVILKTTQGYSTQYSHEQRSHWNCE